MRLVATSSTMSILNLRRWISCRRPAHRNVTSTAYRIAATPETVRLARGYISAVFNEHELDENTLYPFAARLVRPLRSASTIWMHKDSEDAVPRGTVAVSSRVRERLGLGPQTEKVRIEVPRRADLRVSLPPVVDIPSGAVVQVDKTVRIQLQTERLRKPRMALLTSPAGIAIPVRLQQRRMAADKIAMPMHLRTIIGVRRGSRVQLTAVQRPSIRERLVGAEGRVLVRGTHRRWVRTTAVTIGLLIIGLRQFDRLFEWLLRLAFRSQSLSLRVTQSHPGDDDLRDTVRIHPSLFAALGIRPGGQVIMNWGRQRVAVRALEDQLVFNGQFSRHVLESVGLPLDATQLPADFPAHLVIRVPAPVRRILNIPPNTIVEIRRKLRPAIVGQLNQLAVPVAGLVAAAAALPEMRGWPLILGSVTATVLGLAPLRMPRPPRGQWP